jgi:EAL domain-containing protein (putative c-di-GMP-specific phosphodiesterase class I)
VRDLARQDDSAAIARAVASLGVTTTAKGVETEDRAERLRPAGCTEIQGKSLHPARPAQEFDLLPGHRPARSVDAV